MTLFAMTPDTASKVYEAFITAEALSEEERLSILAKFVDSGEVRAITTACTRDEVIRELAKHFSILAVKKQ